MPREREPSLHVPQWQRLDSGLYIPSSVANQLTFEAQEVQLPAELKLPAAPVAIVGRLPTSADQLMGALNEEELGLPKASLAELTDWVKQLPFEPAMLLLARVAASLWHIRDDGEAQLRLIENWNIPNLVAAARRALARDRDGTRLVVFAEQYVTALQRLLVEHAVPRRHDQGASEPELRFVVASYFATATAVSAADEHLQQADPAADEWLTYLLKNGVYNSKPNFANTLTRYHELIDVLPPAFEGHPQFCPLPEWHSDVYGLTPIEQHAVGFYSYSMTNALDETVPVDTRSLIRHPFAESVLADRVERIEEILSASRETYAEGFSELGEGPDAIAWERRPFLRHPFLRCEDDAWLLLFPRAAESWLGEGLHFRSLDAAWVKDETRRYNNFFGHLFERYCFDLAASAYPLDRVLGSGRAHPEQVYGRRGGLRTFDIALDFGPDLIAVETVAARLTAEMQVFGRPEVLAPQLEKMLFKKVRQLAKPVGAVLAGQASIPDVMTAQIERVWPVVVTAGPLLVTEMLWDRIDEQLPAGLRGGRVERLAVLDIDDFEFFLAIGASGVFLPDVLRQWLGGPYRTLDFSRFATQEMGIDPTLRLPLIEQRWEALGERTRDVLFAG